MESPTRYKGLIVSIVQGVGEAENDNVLLHHNVYSKSANHLIDRSNHKEDQSAEEVFHWVHQVKHEESNHSQTQNKNSVQRNPQHQRTHVFAWKHPCKAN